MKKFLLFLLLSISVNAQTLSPGDIVVIAINGDSDAARNYGRGFSFMPLVYLEEGNIINFTDYGWSDVTSAFINNNGIADAFIHYTVPAGGITAGTVVRCDQYTNTNFTFDYSYSGSGYNYLNIAGLTQGDELLIFQGNRTSPTFIFAASIVSTAIVASGWASNVGTNGTDGSGAGSALPPGLTDDVTALSFNKPASGNDNAAYSGVTTATTKAVWQDRIKNFSDWTFNDAASIPTPLTGPFTVTDALPVELTCFTAAANGNSVQLNWQTATEVNNYGFEIERTTTPGFATPSLIKEGAGGGWEVVGFVEGNGNSNSPKEYSFVDANPPAGNLQYRLKQIDTDGSFEYYSTIAEVNYSLTGVDEKQMPTEFALLQNYPNPFNPSTTISYQIPVGTSRQVGSVFVQICIYDVLGNEVATLVNEEKAPGNYKVTFSTGSFGDAGKYNLSSGTYFYRIKAGEFTATKKLMIMK